MPGTQPPRRGNDRQARLPTKTCAACGRPFVWRKKWARDWERVRYCSNACRKKGAGPKHGLPQK